MLCRQIPKLRKPLTMNLMTISQSLTDSFKKHKICPDIINKFESKGLLTIQYNEDNQVALGNTLKVKDTQSAPKIQFTLNSPNNQITSISQADKFTLILTDPDAPSNKDNKWSQFAHWIVTDLPLNQTDENIDAVSIDGLNTVLDYSKGKELVPYMGPGPPTSTGKHRYIFFLYKQDPSVKSFQPLKDRPNWGTGKPGYGVKEWVQEHGNMEPYAVNFFYAQNEKQD